MAMAFLEQRGVVGQMWHMYTRPACFPARAYCRDAIVWSLMHAPAQGLTAAELEGAVQADPGLLVALDQAVSACVWMCAACIVCAMIDACVHAHVPFEMEGLW